MIQVETTPNPESLKFLSENTISTIGIEEFQKNDIDKVINQLKSNFNKMLNKLKMRRKFLNSHNYFFSKYVLKG